MKLNRTREEWAAIPEFMMTGHDARRALEDLATLHAEVERLRGALEAISAADAVELAFDPEWPQRIACAAIQAYTAVREAPNDKG
jgi:hypothetical protein